MNKTLCTAPFAFKRSPSLKTTLAYMGSNMSLLARGEVDAEAGTLVTLPKNVPHAWGNRATSRLRMAFICFPGGAEDAMRIIAKDEVVDLPALAAKFAVTVLGPTPF